MARTKSSSSPLTAVVAGILVCVASVSTRGQITTADKITFPAGHGSHIRELSGVIYKPRGYNAALLNHYPAVVMMHGCSGIWSERVVGAINRDGSPNLQNNIDKWGKKLAESNIVALAVDSFTPRQPANIYSSEEWQNQCSDNAGRYAGAVNPYTERVQDARAAWDYLNAMQEINGSKIGLLGWSHGAQSVMVEVAETDRLSNVSRPESDHKFACSVAFYPGCGVNLGFGPSVAKSFWRPFRAMQLHVGECDPFYMNCITRKNLATTLYSKAIACFAHAGAKHHFDAYSRTWPTSLCDHDSLEGDDICSSPSNHNADECAMRAADFSALDFLLSALL